MPIVIRCGQIRGSGSSVTSSSGGRDTLASLVHGGSLENEDRLPFLRCAKAGQRSHLIEINVRERSKAWNSCSHRWTKKRHTFSFLLGIRGFYDSFRDSFPNLATSFALAASPSFRQFPKRDMWIIHVLAALVCVMRTIRGAIFPLSIFSVILNICPFFFPLSHFLYALSVAVGRDMFITEETSSNLQI